MDAYYFTFHSMTQAQTAAAMLARHGNRAVFLRAPRAISVNGCGYAVQVSLADVYGAIYILRSGGISPQKVFRTAESGEAREVFL